MNVLRVDPGILLYGIRINLPERWAAVFFGAIAVVVWGSGEGKANIEAKEAKIRREARKRCLDEIVAFYNGRKIENGIGVDIIRAHLLAQLAEACKRGYREWE